MAIHHKMIPTLRIEEFGMNGSYQDWLSPRTLRQRPERARQGVDFLRQVVERE
jgi:hypothetical protein